MLVSGLVAASETRKYVTDSSGNIKPSSFTVDAEVGRFTRACSYDHPGSARENGTFTTSTVVPQPCTPLNEALDREA